MGIKFHVSDDLPDYVPALLGHRDGQTLVWINYNLVGEMAQQERMDMLNLLLGGCDSSTPKDCPTELAAFRERRDRARPLRQTG